MREIKHLSVHQWIRSAIRDSQQPTSPIGFLFLKLPPPPCAVLLVITILLQLYSPWYPHIVSTCSVSLLYLHDIPILFPCISQNFPSTSPWLYTNPCDFPHVSQDFYMISTWYYHVPIIFPTCSHHFPMIFPRAFPRFSDFPAFSQEFPGNFQPTSTGWARPHGAEVSLQRGALGRGSTDGGALGLEGPAAGGWTMGGWRSS